MSLGNTDLENFFSSFGSDLDSDDEDKELPPPIVLESNILQDADKSDADESDAGVSSDADKSDANGSDNNEQDSTQFIPAPVVRKRKQKMIRTRDIFVTTENKMCM